MIRSRFSTSFYGSAMILSNLRSSILQFTSQASKFRQRENDMRWEREREREKAIGGKKVRT